MNDFLRIFKWFEKNMFKLIFILICLIIIYTFIIFLFPIFQFIGFISDGVDEIQNIFQEMEKNVEEFEWNKEPPKTPYDDHSV